MSYKYRLLGYPLRYSLSAHIHQLFAQQSNLVIDYRANPLPQQEFASYWHEFWLNGGKGLNITTPYKVLACEYVNELKPNAKLAKAINTVGSTATGEIWGDNTDGVGFANDLARHEISLHGMNVLILGAGGAVRGILQKVAEFKPNSISVVNRDLDKANCLATDFSSLNIAVKTYADLAHIKTDFIINALSVDANFFELVDFYKLNCKYVIYYDLNYAEKIIDFHKYVVSHGAKKTLDGLGMLVYQAAEAFYLWHGITPKIEPILAQLRQLNTSHLNVL